MQIKHSFSGMTLASTFAPCAEGHTLKTFAVTEKWILHLKKNNKKFKITFFLIADTKHYNIKNGENRS